MNRRPGVDIQYWYYIRHHEYVIAQFWCNFSHNEVIWTSRRPQWWGNPLFVQQIVQANNKESIKASHLLAAPKGGKWTGNQWLPETNDSNTEIISVFMVYFTVTLWVNFASQRMNTLCNRGLQNELWIMMPKLSKPSAMIIDILFIA